MDRKRSDGSVVEGVWDMVSCRERIAENEAKSYTDWSHVLQ